MEGGTPRDGKGLLVYFLLTPPPEDPREAEDEPRDAEPRDAEPREELPRAEPTLDRPADAVLPRDEPDLTVGPLERPVEGLAIEPP